LDTKLPSNSRTFWAADRYDETLDFSTEIVYKIATQNIMSESTAPDIDLGVSSEASLGAVKPAACDVFKVDLVCRINSAMSSAQDGTLTDHAASNLKEDLTRLDRQTSVAILAEGEEARHIGEFYLLSGVRPLVQNVLDAQVLTADVLKTAVEQIQLVEPHQD